MAQEYTVTQFQPSDFRDDHGNTWCDMVLQGIGEPVKIVVKDPNSITTGAVLYGTVKEMTSKAGKQYNRFYREQRPEQAQGGSKYEPRADHHEEIKAQWAIGQAVQMTIGFAQVNKEVNYSERYIEEEAKKLYAMVERVKGSSESTSPKAQTNLGEQTVTTTSSKPQARDWDKLGQGKEEDVDAEYESLVKSAYASEAINLDDIPF